MTKSEIALELTKLAVEKGQTRITEALNIAESEKEIFNMFIKNLEIYDNGDAIDHD